MSDQRVARPVPTAFEALYRREFPAVVALAYVLSGSRHAAEELAQDAFLAAHRRWDDVCEYDDPAAWVRRVCANRSVSLIRRRMSEARAMTRLAGRRALPDELPPDASTFWRAVRRLPARQAQVVALRYLEDMAVADIAAVLGCAEGTVKAHLHRARRSLAAELECELKEEER
ncbi:MAG TPA: sigma-70 family RNA polymerase sigma factor [Acidimicrobiales bacterium]|nr:sigma-70 family RNA polymerase sigma factor [Acidimicrobiales bacterium]